MRQRHAALLASLLLTGCAGRTGPAATMGAGDDPELMMRQRAAADAYAAGDLAEAQAGFETLAKVDPKASAPHMGLAAVALRRHDEATAQAELEQVLARSPEDRRTRQLYAGVLVRTGQLDLARDQLRLLTQRGLGRIEHQLLGALHVKAGRLTQAAESFDQLLRRDADDPAGHLGMGVVSAVAGDLEGALVHLERALGLDPKNAVALYDLSLVHYVRGDYARAAAFGERAVAADPWFPPAANNLAAALVQLGRDDDAERALDAALSEHPRFAPAHSNLGVLRMRARDLDGAALAFDEAATLAPTQAAYPFNLGLALYQKGDLDHARDAFAKALAIDPQHRAARANLEALDELRRTSGNTPKPLPVQVAALAVGSFAP